MSFNRLYAVILLADWLGLTKTVTTGFYADDSLQQTIPIPRLRHKQKDEVREEILSVLGLDHAPRPVSKAYDKKRPPDFMLDLYSKLQNDEAVVGHGQMGEDDIAMSNSSADPVDAINSSDMIVSFYNQAGKGDRHHQKERKLFFDFRDVAPDEEITGAELRLYKVPTDRKKYTSQLFDVEIFRILPSAGTSPQLSQLEDRVSVNGSFEGWLVLNISQAGLHWQVNPSENLGLLLAVTDMNGKEISPRHVEIYGMKAPEVKRPFMLGFFKQAVIHSRTTRAAKKKRKKGKRKPKRNREDSYALESHSQRYTLRHCQRKTLYVSFRDLGWQDWIIAPDGYSAYYCEGECSFPLNAHMNATNHAIVQTLVHLMNPSKIPKPCCAPTKLSSISVLYFDESSNVILKKYRNMMVRSCGCH